MHIVSSPTPSTLDIHIDGQNFSLWKTAAGKLFPLILVASSLLKALSFQWLVGGLTDRKAPREFEAVTLRTHGAASE